MGTKDTIDGITLKRSQHAGRWRRITHLGGPFDNRRMWADISREWKIHRSACRRDKWGGLQFDNPLTYYKYDIKEVEGEWFAVLDYMSYVPSIERMK